MQNQIKWMAMDKLRGALPVDQYEIFLFGLAAMEKIIGRKILNHCIQRHNTMSGFTDELRKNIEEDAEIREMIEFILSEIIIPVDDMMLIKMVYDLMDSEEIEDLLIGYNMSFERNNENNASESIDRLVIKILKNLPGDTLIDYCSGRGNMLALSYLENAATQLYGQEITEVNYMISKIKLYALGAKEYHIALGDVITSPAFLDEDGLLKKFDKVYSNFPYGFKISEFLLMRAQELWKDYKLNLTKSNKIELAFIGLLLNSIKNEGKAIAVIPNSLLYNGSDQKFRKALIDNRKVEAIIKLPDALFTSTNIGTALLILGNENKSVKMIDASNIFTKSRRKKELSEVNIEKIYALFLLGEESKESRSVSIEDIIDKDYLLDPYNYLEMEKLVIKNPQKLGKVTEMIFRGIQLGALESDQMSVEKSDYQILRLSDIEDGQISEELPYVKVDDEKKYSRYILEDGDLVITAKGTIFKVAVVRIKNSEKIIVTGNLMVIRTRKERVNPFYLKVFLDSETGKKIIKSIQTGTAMISISTVALRDLDVSVIDMEKQNQIANLYLEKQEVINKTKTNLIKLEKEISNLYESIVEVNSKCN